MSNRLTIKGQVTVPKHVRELLGLTSGSSSVEFVVGEDGSVTLRKAEQQGARRSALASSESVVCRPAVDRCDRVLGLLSGCFV